MRGSCQTCEKVMDIPSKECRSGKLIIDISTWNLVLFVPWLVMQKVDKKGPHPQK